ncbi:MAG: NAD-dependent deacylase [Spirosomaceae bacterium]|jgi:NAD-dependent deacetylase|nr:NAD-dependent deacylase [Spirosomataceae bacterium]
MKKLVVLSGAGISAESGILTFRDTGGLWENHSIEDVATPEGWRKNPQLVLDFYNQRRKQSATVEPNAGHLILAELEKYFDVHIITQNVDNLHERAGSSNILHLHGELSKVRSSIDDNYIIDIGDKSIQLGDLAPDGSQLRPHIVWFGEMVPMIEPAAELCMEADIFVVVGTSMQVYPAAGLIQYVPMDSPKFVVDPNKPEIGNSYKKLTFIQENATTGVAKLRDLLLKEHL